MLGKNNIWKLYFGSKYPKGPKIIFTDVPLITWQLLLFFQRSVHFLKKWLQKLSMCFVWYLFTLNSVRRGRFSFWNNIFFHLNVKNLKFFLESIIEKGWNKVKSVKTTFSIHHKLQTKTNFTITDGSQLRCTLKLLLICTKWNANWALNITQFLWFGAYVAF